MWAIERGTGSTRTGAQNIRAIPPWTNTAAIVPPIRPASLSGSSPALAVTLDRDGRTWSASLAQMRYYVTDQAVSGQNQEFP